MNSSPQALTILSIDTSLPILSVAITRGDQTIGSVALEGKLSRNEKLLPAVDWLLRESDTDRSAIDLLAVTRGPGSFTGVRIGLATVQGLALSLNRPVCAMSTHAAIAEAVGVEAVLVVAEAGRGEFYATAYRGLEELFAPRLLSASQLERAASDVPLRIVVEEWMASGNVALHAARRAWRIASVGLLEGYADLTPIYVRLAEAEVRLEQSRNG
ncbi:MAG: tRNA (adenosine(37)-N6)-threonylcarbamoyltransferase complex dimerization subunit type 1 TsaB [Acidobacteriota bacterium]